jgi:hypothetical protein
VSSFATASWSSRGITITAAAAAAPIIRCGFAIAKVTDNGARYLLSDWEWFIPLDDPAERFANRQRIRAGFGYRHDRSWRFEALYMWSRSRDTTGESFKSTDHILDLRVKRVF